MNELNLVEILKDCPKGTKLYSPLFGEVKFGYIDFDNKEYPIVIEHNIEYTRFTQNGRHDFCIENQECMLFPSKDVRTWDNFKPKKPKFDPKTLKAFDKVLVRDKHKEKWNCNFFSHVSYDCVYYPYIAINTGYTYCIPYNDETKHLVGTTDEAPEYYRYWEE